MSKTRQEGPELNPRSILFDNLLDEPSLGEAEQGQLDCNLAGFRMLQLALTRNQTVILDNAQPSSLIKTYIIFKILMLLNGIL